MNTFYAMLISAPLFHPIQMIASGIHVRRHTFARAAHIIKYALCTKQMQVIGRLALKFEFRTYL